MTRLERAGACLVVVLLVLLPGILAASFVKNQQDEVTGRQVTPSTEGSPSATAEEEDDVYQYNDDDDETALIYLNSSDYSNGRATNATRHTGFLHGFVESLSVILVSEVGDKTFFIAAILAMSNDKLTVFLAAISALALMTVLSALLGWVVTKFIPSIYTHYACTALMFLFGLKMLWEAWRMSPDEAEEIQQEVMEELERRGSIASRSSAQEQHQQDENSEQAESGDPALLEDQTQAGRDDSQEVEVAVKKADVKKKRVQIQEKSLFGKKCYKIFKLFVNCFTMTFLAEWGDRSQLATIVLAGINDVAGVCIGGVLGHTICTGAAVVAGALVAKRISPRTLTVVGALVFLGFAVYSLFYGPDDEEEVKIDL